MFNLIDSKGKLSLSIIEDLDWQMMSIAGRTGPKTLDELDEIPWPSRLVDSSGPSSEGSNHANEYPTKRQDPVRYHLLGSSKYERRGRKHAAQLNNPAQPNRQEPAYGLGIFIPELLDCGGGKPPNGPVRLCASAPLPKAKSDAIQPLSDQTCEKAIQSSSGDLAAERKRKTELPPGSLGGCTTVMITNLPPYSQAELQKVIEFHGFSEKFDYLHMPGRRRIRKASSNVGFAFVNFVGPDSAQDFCNKCNNASLQPGVGGPVVILPADVQGLLSNAKQFLSLPHREWKDPTREPLFFVVPDEFVGVIPQAQRSQ